MKTNPNFRKQIKVSQQLENENKKMEDKLKVVKQLMELEGQKRGSAGLKIKKDKS